MAGEAASLTVIDGIRTSLKLVTGLSTSFCLLLWQFFFGKMTKNNKFMFSTKKEVLDLIEEIIARLSIKYFRNKNLTKVEKLKFK